MRKQYKIILIFAVVIAVTFLDVAFNLTRSSIALLSSKSKGMLNVYINDVQHSMNDSLAENITSVTTLIVPSNETHLNDTIDSYQQMLNDRKNSRNMFLHRLSQQQNSRIEDDSSDTRYLILKPLFSGLGNNMAVLAESILISFMTNRRFYLYKWESFAQYYTLPFSNYIYPDDSFMKGDTLQSDDKKCTLERDDILNSTKKFLVLHVTCKMVDYLCFSDRYYDFLYTNGFVLHPHLKSGADIRKTMMSFLYNDVIALQPDIKQMIEDEKTKLNWNDNYVIGLQIRTGKMGADDAPGFFLETQDIEMFILHAKRQTERAMNKTSKPIKWFIAADNKLIKRKFRSLYPQYFLDKSCFLSHSNRDLSRSKRSPGLLCSLYDSYLLSSVDEAIITAKSTFGILAISRSPSMKRIQVNKGDWKKYAKTKTLDD